MNEIVVMVDREDYYCNRETSGANWRTGDSSIKGPNIAEKIFGLVLSLVWLAQLILS